MGHGEAMGWPHTKRMKDDEREIQDER